MSIKTVAVYFDDPHALGPPFDNPVYLESYDDFSEFAKEKNIRVFFARGNTYQPPMTFTSGYYFKDHHLVALNEQITVDAVLVKGTALYPQLEQGAAVVNVEEFDTIVGDKWNTYELLSQYMKLTKLLSSDNFTQAIHSLKTGKVVLKPRRGSGGRGVLISDRDTLLANPPTLQKGYIAQEFVDTSAGIPGVTASYHDLRIVVFNGEISGSFIRVPRKGALISNFDLGGFLYPLNLEEIPPSIIEHTKEVDALFAHFTSRIYTVDWMVEDGTPFLCELNPQPGFPNRKHEGNTFTDTFYGNVLRVLDSATS